mmetsp:Transcript_87867/g.273089  ORF Transcript_87867/g.273089 Transcript_87867/m.273089 type:complete len:235 (+) Transcript_87867:324-1028(+)
MLQLGARQVLRGAHERCVVLRQRGRAVLGRARRREVHAVRLRRQHRGALRRLLRNRGCRAGCRQAAASRRRHLASAGADLRTTAGAADGNPGADAVPVAGLSGGWAAAVSGAVDHLGRLPRRLHLARGRAGELWRQGRGHRCARRQRRHRRLLPRERRGPARGDCAEGPAPASGQRGGGPGPHPRRQLVRDPDGQGAQGGAAEHAAQDGVASAGLHARGEPIGPDLGLHRGLRS